MVAALEDYWPTWVSIQLLISDLDPVADALGDDVPGGTTPDAGQGGAGRGGGTGNGTTSTPDGPEGPEGPGGSEGSEEPAPPRPPRFAVDSNGTATELKDPAQLQTQRANEISKTTGDMHDGAQHVGQSADRLMNALRTWPTGTATGTPDLPTGPMIQAPPPAGDVLSHLAIAGSMLARALALVEQRWGMGRGLWRAGRQTISRALERTGVRW